VSVFLGYGNGYFANQTTYPTDGWPASVAVGDFNNDARLDIAVANDYDSCLNVFLGYGNGSFANQLTLSIATNPTSMAVADFNKDTQLDIVVANGQYNVGVFLGYGNGSLAQQIMYPTGFTSWVVAVGDFNNDIQLDIVVTNQLDNNVSVLLHYTRGSLRNEISLASGGGSRLRYIAVDDFNNDTILDIVIVNYGTNNVGVLLGYGNGSFRKQTTFSTGSNSHPYSIAIGDYNKDNQLDFAVANSGTKNVNMFLGNGTGMFARQTTYEYDWDLAPLVVAAGDFNHDGQSEIAVTYDDSDDLHILVAYNTGTFTLQVTYLTAGSTPQSVVVADFNNDNCLDIIICNDFDDNVGVFLGYGNGSFANQTTFSTGSGSVPVSVAVGDFNDDTQLDIVVANKVDSSVSILLGYGNGSFANQTTYSTGSSPSSPSSPSSVAVGDFNNDTQLDIVVTNLGLNNIGVFLGYGNGSFANQTTYSTGAWPNSVAVGDFNDDARPDIVVTNLMSNDISLFLGYGNGSFANQTTYSTGFKPNSVAVGDFNNDTQLDIVVANRGDSNVGVFLGYGNGSFAKQKTYSTGLSPNSVNVGDFNNDNRLDIVVANTGEEYLGVFLGDGNDSFTHQLPYLTGGFPLFMAMGDFNNDTRLDIVVDYSKENNVRVFFGEFNWVFKFQLTLTTGNGSFPESLTIGDFNNDTHMDISVVNSGTNTVGIFLGYGNLSFTNQMTFSTGSSPCSIAVADFNNDTRLDIVVANSDDDNIGILLGYGNGTFANQTTYLTGLYSQPHSVAVGDFNNDTLQDVIVASYGISKIVVLLGCGDGTFNDSKEFSIGYGSFPFSTAIGDFNNDRRLDFAVANYGTDNLQIFLQTC
jgi:predicted Zn-dependent protease with MMP-like domain